MAYPIKKRYFTWQKKTKKPREKGFEAGHSAAQCWHQELSQGLLISHHCQLHLSPQARFSVSCRVVGELWLSQLGRTMSREGKRPASPMCLFVLLRKPSAKSSSRFPLTPHWLELHPCHPPNQLLSRGMGSWPSPGAGAKSMHRRPTVSAFSGLPLPWTSDSKALPKKIRTLSPNSPVYRRRRTEFQKNEWIFVCEFCLFYFGSIVSEPISVGWV